MTSHQQVKYESLDHDSSDYEDQKIYTNSRSQRGRTCCIILLLFLLLELVNVSLFFQYTASLQLQAGVGFSDYADFNEYNVTTVFKDLHFDEQDSGLQMPSYLSSWDEILPETQGVISVPTEWAKSRNLPFSLQSPTNPQHSIYQISVFHQLHCLKMMQKHIESREMPNFQLNIHAFQHILHCVSWIRDSLMCNSDTTLDPTTDFLGFGNGNIHQCRDYKALSEWAYENRFEEIGKTLTSMYGVEKTE